HRSSQCVSSISRASRLSARRLCPLAHRDALALPFAVVAIGGDARRSSQATDTRDPRAYSTGWLTAEPPAGRASAVSCPLPLCAPPPLRRLGVRWRFFPERDSCGETIPT